MGFEIPNLEKPGDPKNPEAARKQQKRRGGSWSTAMCSESQGARASFFLVVGFFFFSAFRVSRVSRVFGGSLEFKVWAGNRRFGL